MARRTKYLQIRVAQNSKGGAPDYYTVNTVRQGVDEVEKIACYYDGSRGRNGGNPLRKDTRGPAKLVRVDERTGAEKVLYACKPKGRGFGACRCRRGKAAAYMGRRWR